MPVRYPRPPEPEPGPPEAGAGATGIPGSAAAGALYMGAVAPTGGPGRTTHLFLVGTAVALAALALVVAGIALGGRAPSPTLSPDSVASYFPSTRFEAVELAGGETYFAKVSSQDGLLQLSDVYYVSQPGGQLVQRGGEPFAPDGPMIVNPAQVVKIEPVGADSVIARQIAYLEKTRGQHSPMTTTTTVPIGFQ